MRYFKPTSPPPKDLVYIGNVLVMIEDLTRGMWEEAFLELL